MKLYFNYSSLLTAALVIGSVQCVENKDGDQQLNENKNQYGLSTDQINWMRDAASQQLKGSRVKGAGNVWIYTPDGVGHYKALWTRDFYYMVEYAGELIDPDEIKASIYYLLNGQRDDGCIPDRVNVKGEPIYSPGAPNNPLADHALDNGPFMAMLVCSYVNRYDDKDLFLDVEAKLRNGLEQVNRLESGMVFNSPDNPQCVYGFTDIVKKTGNLLFSSLLFYKASLEMEKLCRKYNCGDPEYYKQNSDLIRKSINELWDDKTGMYWAADIDCKQIDIWGSAYAVEVGITTEEQTERISNYYADHSDEVILRGQIRHLPKTDSSWEKLFIECDEGTYQNGAYWATPLAWVVPTIARKNPELAKDIINAVIKDFQENGINECINDDYFKIPNFVVSATNVYSLTR